MKDQSKPTMFEGDIVYLKLKAKCYLNLRNSALKKKFALFWFYNM